MLMSGRGHGRRLSPTESLELANRARAADDFATVCASALFGRRRAATEAARSRIISSVSVRPSVVSPEAVCGRFFVMPSCARSFLRISCLEGRRAAAALAAFASHSFRAAAWRSHPMLLALAAPAPLSTRGSEAPNGAR